ncbi:glycosyltransferase family 39 protein [Acidipila sp. EB88]|uniref:glycosyltransferase family 39 protein n=1 Tax=Acidipila sp. EB88 TaxID=2305226 RepID=UPI001F285FA7|nr:glycosyltransferase family 39 protein [Acidipila sp. EB88]
MLKVPGKGIAVAAVAIVLCVFALQMVRVARLYSANWDEAHHLYDGYLILTEHDYRANAEVPPLLKIAAALPLLGMHLQLPAPTGTSQQENAFLAGRAFVFGNGGDRLLFPARMMCMLFSLATALVVYAAGRRYFGALAGMCALVLFVSDPNVLAHGTLVSTDMGSALFLAAAVFAFYRYAERPTVKLLAATGVLAGLALVVKFTGILVAPMLLLLAVAEGIRQRSANVAARLVGSALAALGCAWVVLWAFYGFRYAPAPHGLALAPALGPYLASMPNPADGVKLAWVARLHLLPEAYVWGLANTKHTEWEYSSYFWGRVYRHGPWQYFPAAFLIKSTLPLLLLLVLSPVVWLRGCRSSRRHRDGRRLLFLLVPVAVYSAVVVTSHFDIGARHLMPIYPFLYVVAGAVAARLLGMGRGWAVLAIALLVWQVVTTERVAPNYMAYGNEAWGGPLAVRRYLSDANVDWGQQLKTVREYLDRHHDPECWFAYFPDGAVQPQDYGISCHRLPTPSGLWWFGLPMQVPATIHGTVLISESVLDGVESGDGVLNPYEDFRGLKPDAILQDGVYVYRGTFAVPLAAAWVDVRQSGLLAQQGQLPEALQRAQEAAALAPASARTQLQLAEVLAQQQQWAVAGEHYRMARGNLRAQRPDLQQEELAPQIERGLAGLPAK